MFGEDKATHTDSMQTLGTGLHHGQIHTHTHTHTHTQTLLLTFASYSISNFLSL